MVRSPLVSWWVFQRCRRRGRRQHAVCAVVTAVDDLGNESKLPKDNAGCVMAADYQNAIDMLDTAEDGDDEDAIADAKKAIPAGIRAGLDVMPPTIAFSTASPKADASSLKEFQLQAEDPGGSTGKSGLHSDEVLAKIEVRDADGDMICGDHKDVGGAAGKEAITGECKLAPLGDFNDPLATTSGLSAADNEVGYYTLTALAQDKAGNKSEQVMRTAVNDDEAPKVGLIVGGYDKGSWSLTATLTDNLSVKAYWAEAFDNLDIDGQGAGDVLILPREGGVPVDAYNSAELTQSHLTMPPLTMQTYRAMQAEGVDAPVTIDSIRVVATDHGGGSDSTSVSAGALGTVTDLDRFGYRDVATFAADAAAVLFERDEVFQTFAVVDDESDDDALELRATITGTTGYEDAVAAVAGVDANGDGDFDDDGDTAPVTAEDGTEGLVNNPISRVDFYAAVALKNIGETDNNRVPPAVGGAGDEALKFLGSASAAGAEDDSDAGTREYVWGIDMSGADFLEAVDGDMGNYRIFAIAVNSDGVAISAVSGDIAVDD